MPASYSHTTRSDGLTLTAAIYNADHQNHIDNGIPAQLDDYSTNATIMATTTDPGESGTESLATTLAGELERLRFAIFEIRKAVFGGATTIPKWYSTGSVDQWFLNDTTNADIERGMTINQGGNDSQIMAFKSSDVSHGVTDAAETDTFGFFKKVSANDGGLFMVGLSDGLNGVVIEGLATTASSVRSTAAGAATIIRGALKSGTARASLGANTNVLVIDDNGTTRFIFDSDGDSHQDVGTAWTNFDSHDDIALLHGLSAGVARDGDPVREQFRDFLEDNRDKLTALNLVTFNDDGHHFVNMSKLAMLNTGAIRQLAGRLERLEQLLLPSR